MLNDLLFGHFHPFCPSTSVHLATSKSDRMRGICYLPPVRLLALDLRAAGASPSATLCARAMACSPGSWLCFASHLSASAHASPHAWNFCFLLLFLCTSKYKRDLPQHQVPLLEEADVLPLSLHDGCTIWFLPSSSSFALL